MIIKGLFRRYEKWNPVHPTYGAFWGMGIGLGCGVGWGPGFGPEVIGYVGAGCGVGFSVGITLAGIGIGLPANCLIQMPYNAFAATSSGTLDFVRSTAVPVMKSMAGDSWIHMSPHISDFGDKVHIILLRLGVRLPYTKGFSFPVLKNRVYCQVRSTSEASGAVQARCFPPGKETAYGESCW
ncbi:cadmium-induced protein AS8 isoform X2 [Amborella trichopoda]|nr:cadmium-induced protein AS8 isoform X2 [Amborella trichopoda]XP_020518610.1 cadmium-induced protein AS8 isoform X2 [Amborella trichopoda]|eukprot:XP_020518609.1 cadmium-induced protein AS8 isoform X2 [Amborella trichopoda]